MKLLTKAIEARFAKLGRQDTPDAEVVVKFFTPWAGWTWYATEGYTRISGSDGSSYDVRICDADQKMRDLQEEGRRRAISRSGDAMPAVSEPGNRPEPEAGKLRPYAREGEPGVEGGRVGEPGVCVPVEAGPPSGAQEREGQASERGVGAGDGALSGERGVDPSPRREHAERRLGEPRTDVQIGAPEAPRKTLVVYEKETIFFGLVDGLETELGYFTLSELEALRGPWGLKVERDLHFGRTTLAQIRYRLGVAA